MNLVLLFENDVISRDVVRLQGRRREHMLQVLKATAGDQVLVGMLNGLVGKGTITDITSDALTMELRLDRQPPAPLPVTLVLALPRPKMLKRVLFAASSMGVKRLYLINSFRVEKSFWKSPLLSVERMHEYLLLGLEQAKDTAVPEVLLRPLFRPFVEDELPAIIEGSPAFVAHPGAEESCPRDMKRHVILAIGPEGGFISYEIGKLASIGFIPVSLGERPLRVETIVPALLSRIF